MPLNLFLMRTIVIIYFKLMKQHHPSSNENALLMPQLPPSDRTLSATHACTLQNEKINELTFYRNKANKQKKLGKKPGTIVQKLSRTIPQSFNHVYNFLNILSINQHTLKDQTHEESYFKSIFYIKSVEKVELRKNAIIVFTRSIQGTLSPVQYLIERYRSFGDNDFYKLANSIESSHKLYTGPNFVADLLNSYDGEPLSRFIEAMHERVYMCKVAPNKIVISRKLLELLGEDMELYALKLTKYKIPFREIISAESYFPIIAKCIQNIGAVSDFLRQRISFQQLQARTYIEFFDYLYTHQEKKIYCKMKMHMPTPLINCIQVMQQCGQSEDCDRYWKGDPIKRKVIDRQCNEQRYLQAQTLRHLIEISDSLLVNNRRRLAGYCLRQQMV